MSEKPTNREIDVQAEDFTHSMELPKKLIVLCLKALYREGTAQKLRKALLKKKNP